MHLPRFSVRLAISLAALVVLAAPARAAATPQPPATISGRLIPADGAPAAGLRVHLRTAAWADSADADSLGRFALTLPAGLSPRDSVEVRADAADPAARRYHPAVLRLARDSAAAEQRVVLVPRSWTVAVGRHAGERVEISLERAFRRSCAQCSAFYSRSVTAPGPAEPTGLRAWREERFPLQLAFDRDNSGNAITARDSSAFWRIVERVERDFGEDLFRPVHYAAVAPRDDGGPDDVVLVWIEPGLRASGMGTTSGSSHEITFGAVWLQRSAQITSGDGPQLVSHELVHTLGFGHTCSWRSVLADSSRCPAMHTGEVTAHDVAYTQLYRRVAALQRTHGTRWGLEAALDGERWAANPPAPILVPAAAPVLAPDPAGTAPIAPTTSPATVPPTSAPLPRPAATTPLP